MGLVIGGNVSDNIAQYGINPIGGIKDIYVWRHASLELAREAARELSAKHNVEVIVFKIVGSYKPEIIWYGEDAVK
jgi:hypothetical protein